MSGVKLFDQTTNTEHLRRPADSVVLPGEELLSLVQQHEALITEETVQLKQLRRVVEIHRRIADEAEHRLNVRNRLLLQLREAIYGHNSKAEMVSTYNLQSPGIELITSQPSEDVESTHPSTQSAVSPESLLSRPMTPILSQEPLDQPQIGRYCEHRNEYIQPLPDLPRDRATIFYPLGATPRDLFTHSVDELEQYEQWPGHGPRMIRREAPLTEVIYVDAHRPSHIKLEGIAAGCAVIARPRISPPRANDGRPLAFRLEDVEHPKERRSQSLRPRSSARDRCCAGSFRLG